MRALASGRRVFLLRAAVIAAVSAVLYLPSVWNRDLWNPDEPRYAEAAREMTARGDFILPHLNGEVYSEKPPLLFWLSIAAEALPGVPAGSGGRLASAVASAGTLVLTWRIGALLMGEATGTLAALILSTLLVFWQLSSTGVIDPLLTFCCTAAIHGFVRHRAGLKPGIGLFYVACAAGVLAKGPVGLLIPALAAMTWVAIEDGPRGLPARHPLWGIPLVFAPVLAWLAAATVRGGTAYAETMLVRQNVGRAFNAFVHREPLHYFVIVLPLALLPWAIFLPQAIAAAVKEKVGRFRPMLLPLAWFSSVFVLFSVISSKKTRYMLPLTPAVSLLVAGWMMRRMLSSDGRIARGRTVLMAAACLGMLLAAALLVPAIGGVEALPGRLGAPLHVPGSESALAAVTSALTWPANLRIVVPATLLLAFCLWGARLAMAGRGESFAALFAGWLLILAAAALLWTPVLDEIKSARPLAERIQAEAAGRPLYYVRSNHAGAINFYLERERIPVLRTAPELRAAAADPSSVFIGTREEIDRLARAAGIRLEQGYCRRLGEDVLCLASPGSPSATSPG